MKKIIIVIEDDDHSKFKTKVFSEGFTMKAIMTQFIKNYTNNYNEKQD